METERPLYHLEKSNPKASWNDYLYRHMKSGKLQLCPDPEHTENEMITSKNEYVNPKTVNKFNKNGYMISTVDQCSN